MCSNKNYIVINDLPKEQQEPLKKWLIGQTLPIIEEEGENKFNCVYEWDYKKWLSYWSRNLESPVSD